MDRDKEIHIQNQLDKLSEAMVTIARSDEKLTFVVERIHRLEIEGRELREDNKNIRSEHAELKTDVEYNTNTSNLFKRIGWTVITALITIVTGATAAIIAASKFKMID